MIVILIILWIISIPIQAFNIFIKESIRYSVGKGYSPMGGVPLPLWKGKRLLIFQIVAFLYLLIPLIITYRIYGFWTAVIVGAIIYMISYGSGYGRVLFLEYKSKEQ
ncbi:MAG: hypothetical protein KJ666_04220 [Bacteroidetes bacterium]|nr:hypothetical protein [Bacteroidota bacterium]MBU2584228.1 hypothetical protein [Bacteroidota bacterium]